MSLTVMLFLILSIVLNVLLAQWVWRMWRGHRSDKAKGSGNTNTILLKIKDSHVEELVTLRQRFQSVIVDSDRKKIPFTDIGLPFAGYTFVATYKGVITYGNDLSKITISEPVGVNRVKIIVPHSRILDKYVDLNSVNPILDDAGIFANKKLDLYTQRLQADIDEIGKRAIEDGILEQVDRNTALALRSLAESTGLEPEIIFIDAPDESDKISAPKSTAALFDKENIAEAKAITMVQAESEAAHVAQ